MVGRIVLERQSEVEPVVAQVDDGGLLRVGPQSAGSEPGPACYDRGGTMPTVTDADLVLGYINPDTYYGGRMPLNRDRAVRAVREKIAEPMGLPAATTTWT